jgi:hypothetical protein
MLQRNETYLPELWRRASAEAEKSLGRKYVSAPRQDERLPASGFANMEIDPSTVKFL